MKLQSIETAVRTYYECPELGNEEICNLFSVSDTGTALRRLKKQARVAMVEKGIYTLRSYTVDTVTAYEAWGLDIADLERRLKKLRSLGMNESEIKEGRDVSIP